jgi:hypothetical protein
MYGVNMVYTKYFIPKIWQKNLLDTRRGRRKDNNNIEF